jgi:hypothetical protein
MAMDEFTLHWQMGPPGSATFAWNFRQETVEIHTTYMGDGLGSVLQAAIDLQMGSSSAIAFLSAEPGATCLFFAGADANVYLQIVHFSDMESERHRWSGGSLRWHGRINVGHFDRRSLLMAEDASAQCGSGDAHSKMWGGASFPIDKLEILRGSP